MRFLPTCNLGDKQVPLQRLKTPGGQLSTVIWDGAPWKDRDAWLDGLLWAGEMHNSYYEAHAPKLREPSSCCVKSVLLNLMCPQHSGRVSSYMLVLRDYDTKYEM